MIFDETHVRVEVIHAKGGDGVTATATHLPTSTTFTASGSAEAGLSGIAIRGLRPLVEALAEP